MSKKFKGDAVAEIPMAVVKDKDLFRGINRGLSWYKLVNADLSDPQEMQDLLQYLHDHEPGMYQQLIDGHARRPKRGRRKGTPAGRRGRDLGPQILAKRQRLEDEGLPKDWAKQIAESLITSPDYVREVVRKAKKQS